jgi:hypothetical protein
MAFHRNALQIYKSEIHKLQSSVPSSLSRSSPSESGAGDGLNRNFKKTPDDNANQRIAAGIPNAAELKQFNAARAKYFRFDRQSKIENRHRGCSSMAER